MNHKELGKPAIPEMEWKPSAVGEQPAKESTSPPPPRKERREKQRKSPIWIFILIIIILCLALAITVLHYEGQQAINASGKVPAEDVLSGEGDGLEAEPPVDDAEELPDPEKWISVDALKKSAQEHGATTEFLQSLFPDNIVYRQGGVLYYAELDPSVPRNDYDRNSFYTKKGRTYYSLPDGSDAAIGIDVSSHQGEINWEKVAADGIEFAVIRAGFRGYGSGEINPDQQFQANLKGASENGLKVGVYFFSQAINEEEAIAEANYVLESLDGFALDLPVIFDTEEVAGTNARANNMTKEQTTNCAVAFCETIKDAGYEPMVYASAKWYATRLDLPKLAEYDRWLAQYYARPGFPYEYHMWQYSNKGSVAGIKGDVDMNICFKNYWE